MLLEFKVSNFKSIRKEVTLSLIASSDDSHPLNVADHLGQRVLRAAAIYGPNGSGKSSLVGALAFVQRLVLSSVGNQPGQGIAVPSNKLEGPQRPSSFVLQFTTREERYAYGFSVTNGLIDEEYLYFFPNGRQALVFERARDCAYKIGSKFAKGQFSPCAGTLKPNRLMLSCVANFCSVPQADDVFAFFRDDVVAFTPRLEEDWLRYSLFRLDENETAREGALEILRGLGIDARGIRIEHGRGKLDPSALPPFLSEDFKRQLLVGDIDAFSAKVVYDRFEIDLFEEESLGVKKLFSIVGPLLDIISNGKILVCDELESSLHEAVTASIASLFSDGDSNGQAQLLFTTHDIGILGRDLLRRDQIWLTELRRADRSTDLYCLSEIRNVRKGDNLARGYSAGRYGAFPKIAFEGEADFRG